MYIQWQKIIKKLGDFTLNLNLSIKKGELVTLLGPSGCGKTTALRIASGLIEPDKGSFIIDNQDITQTPPSERNIGIVFQNYALFPHLNVEKNIAYGLKAKGYKKPQVKDEIEYILDKLHLNGYNNRNINSLSGGEKQRVALGRSLAIKPRLLLLDEPLSALDAELRKHLRTEIKNIQNEFKISTLYVTHDQEEALSVSDRVAVLKDGELQQFSTPKELYTNPSNEFVAKFVGESNIIQYRDQNLFFRPEDIIKGKGNKSSSINFNGKIVSSEYLGIFYRLKLLTDDNLLINIISNDICSNEFHIPLDKTKALT